MKSFSDYNPAVTASYFLLTVGISMFSMNPVILLLSLAGALSFDIFYGVGKRLRSHLSFILLFFGISFVNLLFSHIGVTVLFVLNDNPVTLESLIYGIASAAAVISSLYWFRSFSLIITSDKLLYLFGGLSPKFSLVLSMALRYIPLFQSKAKKVKLAQKAQGLYNDGNIADSAKGNIRIFSAMITWALEKGIITSDSMAARGYGTEKRTHFSLYRFTSADFILLSVQLSLFVGVCVFLALGRLSFTYYPVFSPPPLTPGAAVCYFLYCILVFIPSIVNAEESIRWKSLVSKI